MGYSSCLGAQVKCQRQIHEHLFTIKPEVKWSHRYVSLGSPCVVRGAEGLARDTELSWECVQRLVSNSRQGFVLKLRLWCEVRVVLRALIGT
jgi:hypothetical protein